MTHDDHVTSPTEENPSADERERRPEGDQQDPDEVTGDVGRRAGGTSGPAASPATSGAPQDEDDAGSA